MSNNFVFNRKLYIANKSKFANLYCRHNFLHLAIEEDIKQRLDMINRKFVNILIYGTMDTLDFQKSTTKLDLPLYDEEEMELEDKHFDLIISHMSMHFVNDIPKVLQRYRKALQPNGLFIATFVGNNSLQNVREACIETDYAITKGVSPRLIPMLDIKTAAALMQQAGFSMPVVDLEKYNVSYKTLRALIDDIRYTGQGNCMLNRDTRPLPRQYISYAENILKKSAESFEVTYEVLTLTGSVG